MRGRVRIFGSTPDPRELADRTPMARHRPSDSALALARASAVYSGCSSEAAPYSEAESQTGTKG